MKKIHAVKLRINILAAILVLALSAFGQGYGGGRASEVDDLKAENNGFVGGQTLTLSDSPDGGNYLDPTFGNNGIVTTDVNGGVDIGWGIARQSDGKIVACGGVYNSNFSAADFGLVRYNVNGTVDTTFGANGRVVTNIGGIDVPSGQIAIQPDGKIVVGGYVNGRANGAIVRYNSNGSLDTGFGTGGIVTYALGSPTNDEGKVLLQPDGKIVFIGIMGAGVQQERQYLVRLNTNGSFDSTFGTNGLVVTNFGDAVSRGYDGVILPDGKILAFGWVANFQLTNSRVAVARYNANGTLDTTFNGTGFVLTGVANASLAVYSGFVQPDGKIVVAGRTLGTPEAIIVLRYNANGTLDNTFGSTGIITVSSANRSLFGNETLYANGKIYVAGSTGTTNPNARLNDFLTLRLNLNGTFDTSFGNGGTVITALTPGDDQVLDLLLQPNGQLLAFGLAEIATDTADFALIRFATDAATRKRQFDFDGDGRADLSVFRPSDNTWYINPSAAPQSLSAVTFGLSSDRLTPADYDGDGKTDIAVWRENSANPGFSYFYILNSSSNTFRSEQFGRPGDNPSVVGDWDGDGRDDPAVYRSGASAGNQSFFFYRPSAQPGVDFATVYWGANGDTPMRGDFDGDDKADAAVFRPSNNTWYILQSSNAQLKVDYWGLSTDKFVPTDYDGDRKTDLAVFRDGVWYIKQSSNNQPRYERFGAATDTLVPADYDGDGRADIAVFRSGIWYLQRSTAGFTGVPFGASTDLPVPNAFVR